MSDLPPFPGFRTEALDFLRDLAANNDREWFKPRKQTFDDELIWPLRCLVADVSRRASEAGSPLRGDPSGSLFRIYRDTRFSKNKDPYKKHVAAVLSREGHKNAPGGLYIHVEPGGSFVAGGIWNPEGPLLRRLRERMVAQEETIVEILGDLERAGMKLGDHGGVLKRAPRGFEKVTDEPLATVLRHKSFVVSRPFEDEVLGDPSFAAAVMDAAHAMDPLLRFAWKVQDREPAG